MKKTPVEEADQTVTLRLRAPSGPRPSPTSTPSLTPTARLTPSTSCRPGEEEEGVRTVKVTQGFSLCFQDQFSANVSETINVKTSNLVHSVPLILTSVY